MREPFSVDWYEEQVKALCSAYRECGEDNVRAICKNITETMRQQELKALAAARAECEEVRRELDNLKRCGFSPDFDAAEAIRAARDDGALSLLNQMVESGYYGPRLREYWIEKWRARQGE